MPRVYTKGGPWKNTEDEVLKAAVMKYGKNQWARIASLLNRKSAKQCKARWYEWLDPSIKKTEWTREEEEKLLHLAKLMPTQWRTIAPIVGRTAAQCMEHYEKLLDQAQERDKDYDPSEDPRRLRPGEIDPNPETKPARPDPVDMDEDEKEMLSEARARLANTKGKKAKRKAREKQLEEARRLAALQKRREMKAAGIYVPKETKKKFTAIDYNAEIPFYKKPAPGFYDTSEEKRIGANEGFLNRTLQTLEGKRRDLEEKKKREEDQNKQKRKREENLPQIIAQINKLNVPAPVRKRVKMSLPSPQATDAELEEIGKLAQQGIIDDTEGHEATRKLLGNYKATPLATPIRTPRTPAVQDHLLLEAKNLVALSQQQTPLVGGVNTPLSTDFKGSAPQKQVAQTPNPLLTPLRTPSGIVPPKGLTTPTPMRDELKINASALLESNERAERKRLELLRKQLRQSFENLPQPSSDGYIFEANIPEEIEEKKKTMIEDAEDLKKRKEAERRRKEEEARKLRSQVINRELPRPTKIVPPEMMDEKDLKNLSPDEQAAELIKYEMFNLIQHDMLTYSMDGKKKKKKKNELSHKFTLKEIENAKKILEEEMKKDIDKIPSLEEYTKIWTKVYNEKNGFSNLTKVKQMFNEIVNEIEQETKKSTKMENKLNITTKGYMNRSNTLNKEISNLFDKLTESNIEAECFKSLRQIELLAKPKRIQELREQIDILKQKEKELQQYYSTLSQELENAQNSS